MSTIETEILEAAGIKAQRGNEDLQKYLGRVVADGNEFFTEGDGEEAWENLSSEAQGWMTKAVDIVNGDTDGDEIPNFPDAEDEDEDEEDEDEEPEESEEEAAPAAKGKGKAPAAKGKGKAPTKGKGKAPTKGKAKPAAKPPKKPSATRRLKVIMLQAAQKGKRLKRDEVKAQIEKEGLQMTTSTCSSFYNDFNQTLSVLVEAGLIDAAEVPKT